MQPVLATNCQATHGILAEVLIDLDAAVFEIDLQPLPQPMDSGADQCRLKISPCQQLHTPTPVGSMPSDGQL
jgi:hypothetical protein